jgi:hypothetical protein
MPKRRTLTALSLAAIAAAPGVAQAHLVVSGMGAVYDGISHFGLSPEDILPVVALGFFAGLRGPKAVRRLLAVLSLAWFAGGLAALGGVAAPGIVASVTAALFFLAIGGLLAANPRLSLGPCAAIAAGLGVARGLADLSGVAASLPHLLALGGICASVFVAFALAASVTLPLKTSWMIVAARVSGSWLAAAGLLLAGWILRYGPQVI